MTTLITDAGFVADDWAHGFNAPDQIIANDHGSGIDLPADTDPATLRALTNATMIRIDFPAPTDGRGFTLAAILRRAGFQGRLRARGHILADQYAMARRSGFDEVEIDDALAARQPQAQWLARADWQAHDYQSRLRG